jgi:predicted RNase H-like HicB family nuclease
MCSYNITHRERAFNSFCKITSDSKIGVTVPDLPGCHTFGDDKADALFMAKDAVEMWLWSAENNSAPIPAASEALPLEPGETLTLIAADTDEYRQANETRAIKKTLSIPSWLNYQAEKANAPFSQILQQGLKAYLRNTD